jgi:hypothetical protein
MENKEGKHKIVKTYAEDMAHVLEDGKGGIIKKIIHGAEEQEAQKRNLSPESKKNKFFMLLGMVLILVSVGTLFFFLIKRPVPSIPVQQQFVPIIFTDKNVLVELAELKKSGIEEKVFKQVSNASVKEGGIEGIYPTLNKEPIGLRKFIALIEGNFAPGDVSLLDDNFLMGAYKNYSQNKDQDNLSLSASNNFFILLKMRSVPDVFDAMHAWETKMFTDLHGFFGIPLSPETAYLRTREFQDGIVENKNARILYREKQKDDKQIPLIGLPGAIPVVPEPLEDEENEIVMMYVFADDNSIIITDSPKAVREIILRLASSQIKK